VLADHRTDVECEPTLQGAGAERIQWQLIWPVAQGQLIGETSSSTSAGGGIRHDGYCGQTVRRPEDVVSVRLGVAGEVARLRIVPLPPDKGSFAWPYYAQGRVMANRATAAGTCRTRSLAADSTLLVRQSPQQTQMLDLRTGQLQRVRPAPDKGATDMMYVGNDFVIIGAARASKRTWRLRRVPLLAGK
jgi:hypothetical protein